MRRLNLACKMILPVAFFGYAAFGNLVLIRDGGFELAGEGVMNGELTAEVDDIYREGLPHRTPAIGLVGATRYALLGEGRDGVVVGRDHWLFSAEEFRALADAPTDLATSVERIAAIRDDLLAAGADLVIVPLPAKLEIHCDRLSDDRACQRSAGEYDDLLAELTRLGVATLDTRPALRAMSETSDPFLRTDTHWTPGGAATVAAALAESGLIPQGDTTFERVEDAPVTFQGDLVSFITSDGLAPAIGLQPETVIPYLAMSSGDGAISLFGDDAASTILVGTSYSANPNWSFAEALKLALGQDVLNMAAEGKGPMVPMLDYMAGPFTTDPAPARVIWEIPVRYLSDPDLWPQEPRTVIGRTILNIEDKNDA